MVILLKVIVLIWCCWMMCCRCVVCGLVVSVKMYECCFIFVYGFD